MVEGVPVTQEEIDVQLDLQNHCWDGAPYIENFLAQSAWVRNNNECIEDILVGVRNEERIDVFPARKAGAPIIVFVHGGWWRVGTRKWFAFCVQGFLELGYAVITSDYALCPDVTIPDITNATRLAIRWAHENAAAIKGDPHKIFVSGHSAGGHQAGMMAVTDWARGFALPADVIKGAIPMSGLFDLRPFKHSWLQPKLQLTGDTVLSESPQVQVPGTAPPILVTLGDDESLEFHRQSTAFVDAWRAKGHRAALYAAPGLDHNTSVLSLMDERSPLCRTIHDFITGCY
jgi:arylformamidase